MEKLYNFFETSEVLCYNTLMIRNRAWRRYQIDVHQARRAAEDRAQHAGAGIPHYQEDCQLEVYLDERDSAQHNSMGTYWVNLYAGGCLICDCYYSPKLPYRFKEQPKLCSCWMCGNQRKLVGPTIQERRWTT